MPTKGKPIGPDTQERGPIPRARRRKAITAALAAALVLAIGFYAVGLDAVFDDRKQRAFMASCVEYHRADRCAEFYSYNRLDLGTRPRVEQQLQRKEAIP